MITASSLTASFSNTDTTSYSTASISPSGNKLILLAVTARSNDGGNPETPTISGNGLTWVLVNSRVSTTNRKLFVFRSMGSSPSTGAITINFGTGNTMRSCNWSVAEFDGVDTSGTNGSGAIVQSAVNSADTTSLTVTLSAFADANNAAYGAFSGADGALSMSVEGGYTSLANVQGGASGDNTLLVEFLASSDTSVSETQTGSNVAGVAIEIAQSSGSIETPSVSPVSVTWSVVVPTVTYEAVVSASVSPVSAIWSVVVPTTTYSAVLSANVSPVGVTWSVVDPTITYAAVASAIVSPVGVTWSVVDPTVAYSAILSASVSPVSMTWSVVSPTVTYIQIETATVSPVSVLWSVISPTVTYIQVETAGVSPVSVTWSVVVPTVTYAAVVSASVSPVSATWSVADPTVTYAAVVSASVSPVSVIWTTVEPTATYVQVETAAVSPVSVMWSTVDPTVTYREATAASSFLKFLVIDEGVVMIEI